MKVLDKHIKVAGIWLFMFLCLGITNFASGQTEQLNELEERALKAGVEQSLMDDLKGRREAMGLTNDQLVEIMNPAVKLAEDNLPSKHVLQKALEGLSKGVPNSQIIPYINNLTKATRKGASVVDPWLEQPKVRQVMGAKDAVRQSRDQMIKSSARAIVQNIAPEDIGRVLSDIGQDDVLAKTGSANVVAVMDILPDLPMKEQPEITRSFIVRALKGGFKSNEIQKIPMALNMAQKRNQIPASNIVEGMADQLKNGIPAQEILQKLFDGNIGGGPPGQVPKGMKDNPGRGGQNGNPGSG